MMNLNAVPRHQIWYGSHRFRFGGMLMMGPDVHQKYLKLSISLIGFTWIGYFFLLNSFVDSKELFLTGLSCFAMNLIFLFYATLTEPGIIPKYRKQGVFNPVNCCPACKIERPNVRTRHCKFCNVCVDTFDHHCPVSYSFILKNNLIP